MQLLWFPLALLAAAASGLILQRRVASYCTFDYKTNSEQLETLGLNLNSYG